MAQRCRRGETRGRTSIVPHPRRLADDDAERDLGRAREVYRVVAAEEAIFEQARYDTL